MAGEVEWTAFAHGTPCRYSKNYVDLY
ncbi:hypothetical protein MASSI9I_20450 [Massilia sp. 9I]|nr:hypothetical protein MASSI9I_20450 [Massilia sp. 9I]